MARGRMKRKRPRAYATQKYEYIYSPTPVTLEELAKRWRGIKGAYKIDSLKRLCSKERWRLLRKDYQKKLEGRVAAQLAQAEADKHTNIVAKAREFHYKSGGALLGQGLLALQEKKKATFKCKKCGEENTVRAPIADLMKPSDVKAFIKEGVDIQRKGLGINEALTIKFETKEIVVEVIKIVQKHVIDVSIYSAIRRDLIDLQKRVVEEVNTAVEPAALLPGE